MSSPVPISLTQIVRVRALEPGDSLAFLTELLHRAYKQHADRGIKALAAFQPEEVTRRRIAGGECYVGLFRGKVVGTILFKDATHTASDGVGGPDGVPWFRRGDVASFSQFAVEPEFQGRGIGGVLMRTVEDRAGETGAAELALSTPEPADWLVAMYQRHGYRVVGRMQWKETNYVSAVMSRPVGPRGAVAAHAADRLAQVSPDRSRPEVRAPETVPVRVRAR